MSPTIEFHALSWFLAVLASFGFGWLWHSVIFKKLWSKIMRLPPDFKLSCTEMRKSIGLELLGTALLAYVLLYSTNIWKPSVWGN